MNCGGSHFGTQAKTGLFRYERRRLRVSSPAVAAIPSKPLCTSTRYPEAMENLRRDVGEETNPARWRTAFVRRRKSVCGFCGKKKDGRSSAVTVSSTRVCDAKRSCPCVALSSLTLLF